MRDREKAFEILNTALSVSKSDLTEAILEYDRLSLARFSEQRIQDHIDREEKTLTVRCIKNKKIGVVATGDTSIEGISEAVKNCEAMQAYLPADENFVTLPGSNDKELKEDNIIEGTRQFGPMERADAIRPIFTSAKKKILEASGAFRQEQKMLAVANSLGVKRFYTGNHAQLSMTMAAAQKHSGWSLSYNPDAVQIDSMDQVRKTADKAMESRSPKELPDGQYTVILEPAAVGQLLILLSFMGFGCKTLYQRRSFMSGQIGERIAGNSFTVYDDASDDSFASPQFDYEGVPKKKVSLIENGVARGVVYNSYYANLMNSESTGHALAPTNNYGPYPKNLVVAPGNSNLDSMISSTKKGVLITHFWYLNFLNPMKTMVTGTTRDGTFYIEDGKVKHPVKNMRTNQSILEAFSNVALISKERIVYPQYSVLMKVPAMKINNFNLTAEQEDDDKC